MNGAGQGDGLITVGLSSHDGSSGNTAGQPNCTGSCENYSEDHDQAKIILMYKHNTNYSEGNGKYRFQGEFGERDKMKQCTSSADCGYANMNDWSIYDDTDHYIEIKRTGNDFELSHGTNSDYTTGRTVGTISGVTLSLIHI